MIKIYDGSALLEWWDAEQFTNIVLGYGYHMAKNKGKRYRISVEHCSLDVTRSVASAWAREYRKRYCEGKDTISQKSTNAVLGAIANATDPLSDYELRSYKESKGKKIAIYECESCNRYHITELRCLDKHHTPPVILF